MSGRPSTHFLVLSIASILTLLVCLSGYYIPKHKFEHTVWGEHEFPGGPKYWRSRLPDGFDVKPSSVILYGDEAIQNSATYPCPIFAESAKEIGIKVAATAKLIKPGVDKSALSVVGFWFVNDNQSRISFGSVHISPGRLNEQSSFRVFYWPKTAVGCELVLIAHKGGPTIEISKVSIDSVSHNSIYQISSLIILLMLVCYIVYLLFLAFKTVSLVHFVLPTILISAMVGGAMLTGPFIVEHLHPTLIWITGYLEPLLGDMPGNRTLLGWLFKLGHLILFFLIALYFFSVRRYFNVSNTTILYMLLLLAVASEGLQLHLQDRGASVTDIAFDWSGIVLGWFVCIFAQRSGFIRSV